MKANENIISSILTIHHEEALCAHLRAQTIIIKKAQSMLAGFLPPDSAVSKDDLINNLLALLDDQRVVTLLEDSAGLIQASTTNQAGIVQSSHIQTETISNDGLDAEA
jgi:hypothetical protein